MFTQCVAASHYYILKKGTILRVVIKEKMTHRGQNCYLHQAVNMFFNGSKLGI